MKEHIVLVTSISPKNIENQRAAIQSWIAEGFRIISCNVKEELEDISEYFPDVEFEEISRSAEELTGKPCPYIYDMLQVLKKKAGNICGIINSDIHLRKFSEGMYRFIAESAEDSVVFMRRQEAENHTDMERFQSALFFGGVDVFFFPCSAIDNIEDDGLILGQAMWDYWLPIMMCEKGVRIKELVNPVAFHIKHPFQWRNDILESISRTICRKYYREVKEADAVSYLKDKFFKIATDAEKICFIPEVVKSRRVLVIDKDEDSGKDKSRLSGQTHKKIVYADGSGYDINDYDYIIVLPYRLWMCDVFLSAMLWVMENYDFGALQAFVYLRGNKSNVIKQENCGEDMLEHFNQSIEPLIMYRSNLYLSVQQGEHILPQVVRMAVCGVWIEEDAELIWKRQSVKGNVYLFPAGYIAKRWVKKYRDIAKEITIKGFVDNDPEIHGMTFEGIRVYEPDVLKDLEKYDRVIIITDLHMEEIYQQLIRMIPEDRITVWKDEYNGEGWRETRRQISEWGG